MEFLSCRLKSVCVCLCMRAHAVLVCMCAHAHTHACTESCGQCTIACRHCYKRPPKMQQRLPGTTLITTCPSSLIMIPHNIAPP